LCIIVWSADESENDGRQKEKRIRNNNAMGPVAEAARISGCTRAVQATAR